MTGQAQPTPRPAPKAPTGDFATTRWSLIARARGTDPRSRQALADLCRIYWYPVYVFFRRTGVPAQEAPDLTQGFFAHFLEKSEVQRADPERGRFRCFVMTAANHFASNQRRAARAEKRGGGRGHISLDLAGELERAEDRFSLIAREEDPRAAFERAWAEALLTRVLERLRGEYESRGQADLFDGLRRGLMGADEALPLASLARETGRSKGALKVARHRMKQRYGQLLRDEIAQTLADSSELEDELVALQQAVAR